MNRTFTLTDLILFAYNETELTETALIVNALEVDEELNDSFQGVVRTVNYIENIVRNPSEKSIENILNYSRKLS